LVHVSCPVKLSNFPSLRSVTSSGSCLAGFGFCRRAQQAHQTLDVRGGTGHQLLDQDLGMAATPCPTTAVTIDDFAQFSFHLQMLAPNRSVFRRLRFLPRPLVLRLVIRLADRTAMRLGRILHATVDQRTATASLRREPILGRVLLVVTKTALRSLASRTRHLAYARRLPQTPLGETAPKKTRREPGHTWRHSNPPDPRVPAAPVH
jgi:hypothetical protein